MIYRLSWLVMCLSLCVVFLGGSDSFQCPVISARGVVAKSWADEFLSPKPSWTANLRLSSESTPTADTVLDQTNDSKLDTSAIFKYLGAIGIQLSLVTVLFQFLDRLLLPLLPVLPVSVRFGINAVGMYFLALKSRVFNPLSNRRPNPSTKEVNGVRQRTMPTWTPPGFVFPIVWLLLIGPLRAITSAMIIQETGVYTSSALLSLMLHLSIGDVWNTINNVEQRFGTSVLGVLCVWASAAFCAYKYYQVLPLAGKLLSLKLIWLTIASSLIVRTWQLNPKSGKRAPLLPTKGDGNTQFEWFANKEKRI